jgi:hypothetical protein
LLLLILAEIGLRLVGIEKTSFYRFDPNRGFSHRAGAKGWWDQEGWGWVEINNAGFRDINHSDTPSQLVLRGAVLGDSFSEAFQVNLQQTWWKKLEKKINQDRNCKLTINHLNGIEIMNFGVGAYGTGQALLTWRENVRKQKPNIVILAMFLGNDIDDNTPRKRIDRPSFQLDGQGNLEIDNSFRESRNSIFRQSWLGHRLDWLVENSRLAQLLNSAKNNAAQFEFRGIKIKGKHLDQQPPNPAPASAEGWATTKALIKELNREVKADLAELIVVSLTSPEQVWPQRQRRPKDAFAREKRLGVILKDLKVPYIALAPDMQQRADAKNLSLHGFPNQQPGIGHWNTNGHHLAADVLAKKLCSTTNLIR